MLDSNSPRTHHPSFRIRVDNVRTMRNLHKGRFGYATVFTTLFLIGKMQLSLGMIDELRQAIAEPLETQHYVGTKAVFCIVGQNQPNHCPRNALGEWIK